MADYAYQYHAPVAPVMPAVPSPDLAAQTIAHFGTAGLQAFVQMNAARQRSDLEARQLAQQAVFQQQNYELEKQKQDHAIQTSDELLPLQKQLLQSHADLFESKAKEWANGQATAAQRLINFNQQLTKVQNEAQSYADELQLTNPEFQTKNPVGFAAAIQKFSDAYGNAPTSTGIRQQISEWSRIADQQKVDIKGVGKVPIWQVVEGLNDPNSQDQWAQKIEDSGLTNTHQFFDAKGKPSGSLTQPNDYIKRWIEGGKGVDWSHVPSRIPMDMARNAGQYAAQRKNASGGDQSLSPGDPTGSDANNSAPLPQAQPTPTDQVIAEARDTLSKAKAKGIDIMPQLSARLQGMGIDPSQLNDEE